MTVSVTISYDRALRGNLGSMGGQLRPSEGGAEGRARESLGRNAFSKLWPESLRETSQAQGLGTGKSVLGRGTNMKHVLKRDGRGMNSCLAQFNTFLNVKG